MARVIAHPAQPASYLLGRLGSVLPTHEQLMRSEVIWLGLVGYLILAKILSETLVPIGFRGSDQQELFDWSNVLLFGALGLIGIWCGRATGFPEAWAAHVSNKQRLLWLISTVVLRGRGQRLALWVLGALAAGFEPVGQGVFLFLGGGGVLTPLMLASYLVTALPSNVLAVILFRRYGLLAPLALRWGEYLIWHILYGNFLYVAVF